MAFDAIFNGTNADDRYDHRPGMSAAEKHGIISPLVQFGLRKPDVRNLARYWGLSVAEKPASPCLASRLAYGLEVTAERLGRIERAEALLRELGFQTLRVRYHSDDLARIEVDLEDLPSLADGRLRQRITECFTELGFRYVTLDLHGFRSGSLNHLVQIQ